MIHTKGDIKPWLETLLDGVLWTAIFVAGLWMLGLVLNPMESYEGAEAIARN